ncbi:enoyl-CoA hydratase [Sphingomonas spermidinifaciens]|uniref:3-hydroxyisobutyryl-CoA hydrolase n=1 Tax=Sphingomonas spermidinifaciens TaxID=1141889 RepID=A0A2A4B7Y2_9SPHN|nr:enoyl-CoA hydratase/isomerase family protein [Sphingomonas spermidinifaciens]PCD03756.1 enoyl-CoA hydratase [Sphingomonas spermidinifaciens]
MTDDIIIERAGALGRIRLNRPKAIHALTADMCRAVLDALGEWADDPSVEAVSIDHAEGRGFCAGGDIRLIAESSASDGQAARDFFRVEYSMNHRLFTFAKPVVAFMDGITMGGGVGISQPATFRVATENTRFAMPETSIGLFPDVGGGWYLSRLPGRMGQFLALTGHRLDGAECMALGLATHYLPAGALDEAKRRIAADPRGIEALLADLSAPVPEAVILAHRETIDRLFASDRLEEILDALDKDDSNFARDQRKLLATKSPQAMKVSLKLLLDGRAMPTFEDEMRQEFAVAAHVVQRPDIVEGVRAVIIDKDHAPRWDPATPQAVSDHLIDRIFAPLPADEEWNPA